MKELTKRIIVALIGIPLAIALIYSGGIAFFTAILILAALSLYEYHGMMKNKGMHNFLFFNILFAVIYFYIFLIYINGNLSSVIFINAPPIIYILFLMIIYMFTEKKKGFIESLASSILGLIYIFAGFMSVIYIREIFSDSSGMLFLAILISIWICDSAAYFIGKSIGRHKLAPSISPKKTWEGSIGGFVFAIVGFYLSYLLLDLEISAITAVYSGAVVGITGQIGDLFESKLKRDAEIKDSSNIIPGHGGILDRFDSLLFVAPVLAVLYSVII